MLTLRYVHSAPNSLEANNHLAQRLWKSEVLNRVHKSSQLVPALTRDESSQCVHMPILCARC